MKRFVLGIALAFLGATGAYGASPQDDVKSAVLKFYAAFNAHDFSRVDEATSERWNHITPLGGRTIGRPEVVKELEQVHSSFLKGVTDTPESIEIEMLAPTTAMATVLSRTSTFTTPDGVLHANELQIRTFVLLRERGRWLIVRDHNTFVKCQAASCRAG